MSLRNENALQTKVLKYLREQGAFVENRSPGPFTGSGVPDLIGCYRGIFFAIELKNPNHHGPPGEDDERWPAQRLYLQNVAAANGYALGTNVLEGVVLLVDWLKTYKHIKDPKGWFQEFWK